MTDHSTRPAPGHSAPTGASRRLPTWGTPFVGRAEELARLGALLARPEVRLVTLLGPGGIGKTRLAVEFLRALPPGRRSLFVALEATADLETGVVEGLGVGAERPDRRLERAAAALATEPTTVVLDNLEHLVPQAPVLEHLLAECPQLTLIATSRAVLGLQGEWVLPVGGLSQLDRRIAGRDEASEALSLFCQRFEQASGRVLSGAEDLSIARAICLNLHGVPLAIELAASWGAALTLPEIAADLEHRRDSVLSRQRGFPERQRSMRAVFEHSWRLLAPGEQRALALLSVFRDGFTRDAAAAVAGVDLDTLAALAEKSLLQRDDSGRHRLHPLVLEFAAEQLAADPRAEPQVRDRHRAYYLDYLQAALPDIDGHRQVEAVHYLLREWANIRAAWERALEQRRFDEAARALYLLDMMCSFRARYDESLDFTAAALDALGGADEPTLRFVALVSRAWVFVRLGQLDEASELARAAEALVPSLGGVPPPGLHLDPLLVLGTVGLARGRYPEAEEFASRAVDRARAASHAGRESLALYVLENALWEQSRHAEAADALATAFAISERIGDSWLLAFLHNDLARQAAHQSRLEQAERHLSRSIELRSAFNDSGGVAIAEEKLAALEMDRGHDAEAEARFLHAISLYRQVGDRGGVASVHAALGRLALRRGDVAAARARFAASLETASEMGYAHLASEVLLEVALWAHANGDRGALPVLALLAGDPSTPAGAAARLEGVVSGLPSEAWAAARRRASALSRDKAVELVLPTLLTAPDERTQGPPAEHLSPRELDVVRLIAAGATNDEIARSLGLKLGTAKWYTSQVFAKLGARNRTEAVARARERDLVP